jgi:hypothetical protein
MYFNFGKGFTILFLALLYVFISKPTIAKTVAHQKSIEAKPTSFTAQPGQCVTLRQGRKCFANIRLQWKTPLKQDVCLFQTGQEREIKCWKSHDHAEMVLEFESNESISYQIRTLNGNKIIAQTQIEVSWLHKSRARKRRWRLF